VLAEYSTGVEGSFKELDLADFNDKVCVIGFVHVFGEKLILDALYNGAAEAGCSGRLTIFAMSAWVRRMHPHSPTQCGPAMWLPVLIHFMLSDLS
jgi:hypothetical protein